MLHHKLHGPLIAGDLASRETYSVLQIPMIVKISLHVANSSRHSNVVHLCIQAQVFMNGNGF